MTLMDTLVNAREALISRTLGFDGRSVLNVAESGGPALSGSELAVALRRAANALKAAGVDAAGRSVDDARLRANDACAILRNDLTPQLDRLDLVVLSFLRRAAG